VIEEMQHLPAGGKERRRVRWPIIVAKSLLFHMTQSVTEPFITVMSGALHTPPFRHRCQTLAVFE
jgi:hypothetical protein